VIVGIIVLFKPHFKKLTDFVFAPLGDYPKLTLFIIMIGIPILFNTLQMWLVDNIIKLAAIRKEDEEEEGTRREKKRSMNKDLLIPGSASQYSSVA